MKAEYRVCRDKMCFKRFVNVRQIFKEAPAVFFMGTLVKQSRKRDGTFVWENTVRGDAGENLSMEERRSVQGFGATCGHKCLVRTAGERNADPLRVYFSRPRHSWIINGASAGRWKCERQK